MPTPIYPTQGTPIEVGTQWPARRTQVPVTAAFNDREIMLAALVGNLALLRLRFALATGHYKDLAAAADLLTGAAIMVHYNPTVRERLLDMALTLQAIWLRHLREGSSR